MHYLLTAKQVSGAVNMVAPESLTNRIFTQNLAEVLKRFAIIPVPKPLLRLGLGESSCLLIDSQRVVPQALLNQGFEFKFRTLEHALVDLLTHK